MKRFPLIILLVLTCFGFAVSQPKPSEFELILDKTTLSLPCEFPIRAKYRKCLDGMTVNLILKTTTPDAAKENRTYEYSISHGKIVRVGSQVVWDLSNAGPGTYEITATMREGNNEFRISRSVTVEHCSDCGRECLDCPVLAISSSADTVRTNGIVELHFDAPGGVSKFEWTVVGGRIIKGKGTARVTIKIDRRVPNNKVHISAKIIDGGFCLESGGCPDRVELVLKTVR